MRQREYEKTASFRYTPFAVTSGGAVTSSGTATSILTKSLSLRGAKKTAALRYAAFAVTEAKEEPEKSSDTYSSGILWNYCKYITQSLSLRGTKQTFALPASVSTRRLQHYSTLHSLQLVSLFSYNYSIFEKLYIRRIGAIALR